FETISIEMERGNPASLRRLETRLLHFEQLAGDNDFGDQFWRGYTYVWNADQTDAVLLEDPRGLDRMLKIKDPAAPMGIREQTWHFPSRAECTVCHNMAAKYVLGMNTLQMNRDHSYGEVTDNQLRTFEHLKLFTGPLPERPQRLPSLADYREGPDPSRPAAAARAYLHANCSHCHRKWGGGNAEFLLLGNLDVGETGIFGRRPQHGGFYIGGAQLVMPGEPQRSVLYYRMATLGPGHMPRLGSNVVDGRGLQLIYDWIWQLGAIARRPPPSKARREVAASIRQLQAGVADAGERKSRIDRLLSTTDSALSLMSAVGFGVIRGPARAQAIAAATAGGDPHVRDLFERFVPESQRTKRLGTAIEPAKILSLAADAARGKAVFFATAGVQCQNCHRINGQGREVGPDLSAVGKKLTKEKLLENILFPSREIDPKFRAFLVETGEGKIFTGLLVEKTAKEVVLRDTKGEVIRVPATQVEHMTPQLQSIMPDLLLRDMTAQQVADLIAFLASLQ
ncbi:MAG: c-type cytochrome, partial [Pirellulales bacterium]